MERQIHHHKSNLLKDYGPGVFYFVAFYATVRLFADVCIRFIAATFGAVPYRDNLAERPLLATVIYLVFCFVCYYANRKTFEISRKESFSLWTKHLGIDIPLYGLCILLAVGYNNFIEKTDPTLRSAGLPMAVVFVFYCKHDIMRRWYRKENRKLRVVR